MSERDQSERRVDSHGPGGGRQEAPENENQTERKIALDSWIEKEEFYIKVHCWTRVLEFDPRKGRMPGMGIGPECITVMRTSGPVFVVGGDYEVGSRTRLREWTGYSVFKKEEMRNEGFLSWEDR